MAEADIETLLKTSKSIAIVGLSSDRHRPSFGVAADLQHSGYKIIPVNPYESEVLGEKAYASLEEVPETIDIVDVFRRSELVLPVVESAIRVGASAVWMQEGVVNEPAAKLARDAGLMVIMDRCIAKDLYRLGLLKFH